MNACKGDCKGCDACGVVDRKIVDHWSEYDDWTVFATGIAFIAVVLGLWGAVLVWWLW